MSQKQNQINIELSDEISKGKYANLAMIAHSSSEFVIDFSLSALDLSGEKVVACKCVGFEKVEVSRFTHS